MQRNNYLGKWILITGCSSGIGLEAAKRLHAKGCNVVASARSLKDVQSLKDIGILSVQIDTSKEKSVDFGLDAALKLSGGSFYAVFHNAGYAASGATEDLPVGAMEEEFRANVFGAHQINVRLIPLMRKNGCGRIIWCSSVLGFFAMKFRGAYVASKFAMEGLADTMRLELKGSGIYVSLLQPGPIATNFRKNSLASFKANIDSQNSFHKDEYKIFESNLLKEGNLSRFTLPASKCVDALEDALFSRRPKSRYRITTPTKLIAWLKRLLPTTLMDRLAHKGI
jgi:short-subunit dehydrogenase